MTSYAEAFGHDDDDVERVGAELKPLLVHVLSRYSENPDDESVALFVLGSFAVYFMRKHLGDDNALKALAAWTSKVMQDIALESAGGSKH
jgi:hypothetical protein